MTTAVSRKRHNDDSSGSSTSSSGGPNVKRGGCVNCAKACSAILPCFRQLSRCTQCSILYLSSSPLHPSYVDPYQVQLPPMYVYGRTSIRLTLPVKLSAQSLLLSSPFVSDIVSLQSRLPGMRICGQIGGYNAWATVLHACITNAATETDVHRLDWRVDVDMLLCDAAWRCLIHDVTYIQLRLEYVDSRIRWAMPKWSMRDQYLTSEHLSSLSSSNSSSMGIPIPWHLFYEQCETTALPLILWLLVHEYYCQGFVLFGKRTDNAKMIQTSISVQMQSADRPYGLECNAVWTSADQCMAESPMEDVASEEKRIGMTLRAIASSSMTTTMLCLFEKGATVISRRVDDVKQMHHHPYGSIVYRRLVYPDGHVSRATLSMDVLALYAICQLPNIQVIVVTHAGKTEATTNRLKQVATTTLSLSVCVTPMERSGREIPMRLEPAMPNGSQLIVQPWSYAYPPNPGYRILLYHDTVDFGNAGDDNRVLMETQLIVPTCAVCYRHTPLSSISLSSSASSSSKITVGNPIQCYGCKKPGGCQLCTKECRVCEARSRKLRYCESCININAYGNFCDTHHHYPNPDYFL